MFPSAILQKIRAPRGPGLAEAEHAAENWALWHILLSCCCAEELPKATPWKFPGTLHRKVFPLKALLRFISSVRGIFAVHTPRCQSVTWLKIPVSVHLLPCVHHREYKYCTLNFKTCSSSSPAGYGYKLSFAEKTRL